MKSEYDVPAVSRTTDTARTLIASSRPGSIPPGSMPPGSMPPGSIPRESIPSDSISRRDWLARVSALAPAPWLAGFAGSAWSNEQTARADTGSAAETGRAAEAGSTPATGADGAFARSFRWQGETLGPSTVVFDGKLPDRLAGTLYRNGPARMSRGDTVYRHWFDGDGMVHAFDIDGQRLTHRAAMVRTTRYVADERVGRFRLSGFGTSFDDTPSVKTPDDFNVANISVLPMGDEVLALWEAGSPWRLDARTLSTLGRKVFSPDTDGMSFSAHPRHDPDGRIWNFGYAGGSGKLALYDLDREGTLKRARVIDAPNADMVHDFVVTRRYLVFLLMPLRWLEADRAPGRSVVDRLRWDDDGAVVALVVDKDTLDVVRRFEVPPFFAFHFGNAWEDGDSIRVEVARSSGFADLMREIRRATDGGPRGRPLSSPAGMDVLLDMRTGSVRTSDWPVSGTDFPRFDQRFTGLRTSRLVMLGRSDDDRAPAFGFNEVVSLDRRHGRISRYAYGTDMLAEEHVFVPDDRAPEGEGFIIGLAYDWRAQRSSVSVFSAARIEAGPIATASLPYFLPLGLHGQFVSR